MGANCSFRGLDFEKARNTGGGAGGWEGRWDRSKRFGYVGRTFWGLVRVNGGYEPTTRDGETKDDDG